VSRRARGRRPPRAERDSRGNVSVLVAAVIVVALLLTTAVARLGGAVAEKSRANNAADAAALAAAGELASGRTPADACRVARRTAADNGARLLACHPGADAVVVTVGRGDARAVARAEVGGAGATSGTLGAHIAHRGDFRHVSIDGHTFHSRGPRSGPISAPMPGTEAER
jgi:secretion/DNA translocation related TadE-like protein